MTRASSTSTSPAHVFEALRQHLFNVAYHSLGSVAEAEDMVQETWVRWQRAGCPQGSPRGYLTRVVSRLCIDHLRSARVRRESYVGPWLPEPLVHALQPSPADDVAQAQAVSLACLRVLESLGPHERVAWVLRQVFDVDYAEIATTLSKSESACRQLVSRASRRVHEPARYTTDAETHGEVVQAFVAAIAEGDLEGLVATLSPNITMYSDGGGHRTAARVPIHGDQRVARALLNLSNKGAAHQNFQPALINGRLGFLGYHGDTIETVLSVVVHNGHIAEIQSMRNPLKLRHV